MKKYIKHLSELTNIKLFFVRYIVNFILFIEIIYLPNILEPESYVKIEFYKNVFLVIPILLFGINSGYLNVFYRMNKDLRIELIFLGLILSLFSSVFYYLIYSEIFFAFAVFCFVFVMSIEKTLVVAGYFILASIYKGIFSLILIFLVTFFNVDDNTFIYYSISIILGTIIWLVCILIK
ncbi:hypothetical protein CRU99_13860, partial [Malaciobacter mytili]|uniref:hypothetical protein n=1 Tax=Malaciobacter mytili TaxID=603050 RepID=UPI001024F822